MKNMEKIQKKFVKTMKKHMQIIQKYDKNQQKVNGQIYFNKDRINVVIQILHKVFHYFLT